MCSYGSPEQRVPADHPLRPIREMVDTILKEMSPRFARLYADVGRPPIAPERRLRALLLQIFCSVRSGRRLLEELNYHLLFRWFVGMPLDEAVWNHAVCSKNRDRLWNHAIAQAFFQRVLRQAKPYLSDEPFTGDGTRLEAWASQKSFRPQQEGEPPTGTRREADFPGEQRSHQTPPSTTGPDARLDKKSKGGEAQLSCWGHVLMENHHGLLVKTMGTPADGTAERDAALRMASQIPGTTRVTRGGDQNYDTPDFVSTARGMRITPHGAPNDPRPGGSAIDGRTTRHAGYASSQQKRPRVEPSFGWMPMIGLLQKVQLRGLAKVSWWFPRVGAADNLMRLRRLRAEAVA